MHAWRPHVKNDKARFCLGPRECQRGGPRGIVVGPTWNVTVFGRGAIPLVSNGATEEKRLCFAHGLWWLPRVKHANVGKGNDQNYLQ
jgi:hypothetical protein